VGHVWVRAMIRNSFTDRSIPVKALVNTGAIDTVIPRRIAEELQPPITGRSTVPTTKGPVEPDEYTGVIGITSRRRAAPMLVSKDVGFPLIGVAILKQLSLEVTSVTGRLRGSVAFLRLRRIRVMRLGAHLR